VISKEVVEELTKLKVNIKISSYSCVTVLFCERRLRLLLVQALFSLRGCNHIDSTLAAKESNPLQTAPKPMRKLFTKLLKIQLMSDLK